MEAREADLKRDIQESENRLESKSQGIRTGSAQRYWASAGGAKERLGRNGENIAKTKAELIRRVVGVGVLKLTIITALLLKLANQLWTATARLGKARIYRIHHWYSLGTMFWRNDQVISPWGSPHRMCRRKQARPWGNANDALRSVAHPKVGRVTTSLLSPPYGSCKMSVLFFKFGCVIPAQIKG